MQALDNSITVHRGAPGSAGSAILRAGTWRSEPNLDPAANEAMRRAVDIDGFPLIHR